MNRDQAKLLIDKYKSGNCSEEEKALIESWYTQLPFLTGAPGHGQIIAAKDNVWDRLMSHRRDKLRLYYRAAIAAAAILVIGIGTWFFTRSFDPETSSAYASDIVPGGNKATLTLANGKTINLKDSKTGIIVKGSGLMYNDGTKVSSNGLEGGNIQTLTAATPIGGTYRLILPDGTAVWLNAATTLKFPSNFRGLKNRTIELTGEAYFEVAKHKIPFIVKTKLQEVRVLGTHFNINSYEDEGSTKTTLLEGSVNVVALKDPSLARNVVGLAKNSVILKPNQQAILTANVFQIEEVDSETIISWKNGEFSFKIESLGSIMKKVARWYNVDVVYADKALTAKQFSGTISKYGEISEVLHLLEVTGEVKFKINGRTVTAMKP